MLEIHLPCKWILMIVNFSNCAWASFSCFLVIFCCCDTAVDWIILKLSLRWFLMSFNVKAGATMLERVACDWHVVGAAFGARGIKNSIFFSRWWLSIGRCFWIDCFCCAPDDNDDDDDVDDDDDDDDSFSWQLRWPLHGAAWCFECDCIFPLVWDAFELAAIMVVADDDDGFLPGLVINWDGTTLDARNLFTRSDSECGTGSIACHYLYDDVRICQITMDHNVNWKLNVKRRKNETKQNKTKNKERWKFISCNIIKSTDCNETQLKKNLTNQYEW